MKGQQMTKGTVTTDAFGNRWERCLPVTDAQIDQACQGRNTILPKALRALFLACNAGRPARTYFGEGPIELEIGAIVGIALPPSFKGTTFEHSIDRLRGAGLAPPWLPLAVDNGNAGIICLNADSGEIAYWVHDEPEDPLKPVCGSLDELLRSLTEPPY